MATNQFPNLKVQIVVREEQQWVSIVICKNKLAALSCVFVAAIQQ